MCRRWRACPTSPGHPRGRRNGRWIVFVVDRNATGCATEIVEVRPDGSARHGVTSSDAFLPAWSPDGREFIVNTRSGYGVVPARGGSPRILIRVVSDQGASFSPDGQRIAYTSGKIPVIHDYRSTLFVAARSGAGPRTLLGNECDPGTPSWSPDGRTIAVGCGDGLYLVNARNANAHRILRWDFSGGRAASAFVVSRRTLARVRRRHRRRSRRRLCGRARLAESDVSQLGRLAGLGDVVARRSMDRVRRDRRRSEETGSTSFAATDATSTASSGFRGPASNPIDGRPLAEPPGRTWTSPTCASCRSR